MKTRWNSAASTGALLLTTLAATGALLTRGASCGHDFDFHLVSWMETVRAWHSGIIYPHWAMSANFGAGEPRFIFYPPASWTLGAVLGIVFGWHSVPWLLTAICLICAGLAMRSFARTWLPPAAACAAACIYIANPYMLFVAYERAAYGELMAATLIPLLFLFAVRPSPPIVSLAATITGIWLMNAPSGVMACYALLWIALLRLASERSWRAPLRMAAANGIALALAAFYLVPAAYERRWVEIARAIGPDMRFQDSFLFHRSGEPFHDAVLHTASIIACAMFIFAMAAILLARDALKQRPLAWLASFVPLILLLLLPVSAPLWRLTPQLGYLQFPWRWLLVLAPIVALWLGCALARCASRLWLMGLLTFLCIAAEVHYVPFFRQTCDDQDNVSAQIQLMHDGDGQEGTDEYTPRDDDNAEIDQDMPDVRVLVRPGAEEPDSGKVQNPEYQPDTASEIHATITVKRWSPEHRTVTIDAPAAGFVVFRMMQYPSWVVRRDGVRLNQLPRRDDGLLTVPVDQGRSAIDISWRITPDLWIGRVVSLAGLCLLCFVWTRERRNRVTI